jgi:RNA polymerase sigma-70 factor (ECF subfamily)
VVADDDALVREAQAGNLASFNALVERHQVALYSLALRYVADPQLAEDVTQEAFISAWRGIGGFKGGSFRAWLCRIAINEARDHHRRNSRRPSSSLDALLEAGTIGGLEADRSAGPEELALSSEALRSVERRLQQLPEAQRLVLLLSDVHGLKYDELAEALGLPLGTVKSRLYRARAALRQLLLEGGELPGEIERLY